MKMKLGISCALVILFLSSVAFADTTNDADYLERAAKRAAVAAHNRFVADLPPAYFFLEEGKDIIVPFWVGVPLFFVVEGKYAYKKGTDSEFRWDASGGESAIDELRISYATLYREENYDDIPNLYSIKVVPIAPGTHKLKLEYFRRRDWRFLSTRTVYIEGHDRDIVFIGKQLTKEIHGVRGQAITIFMEVEYNKDDYKWVVDDSATSKDLGRSSIEDSNKYERVWNHYNHLKKLTVTPSQEGTSVLKLSYQNSDGSDVLRTATVTINV